jgi:hypothetical protein
MGELRPKKIVVNADEERSGKSLVREIITALQSKDNLVATSLNSILFFMLDTDYHYAFRNKYHESSKQQ